MKQFHVPFQMERVFTLEEKTSPESYMLVIHNKVYDVTNFISEVYSSVWHTELEFQKSPHNNFPNS